MHRLITSIAFALAAVAALPALAAEGVEVQDAWARASAGRAAAGGAFMVITNAGEADRLVAARADVAKRVELHTHLMENGVMKMRQVEFVPVPANGSVELKPGSYHVMFMGLDKPFREGESFPLTLVFEKAGETTVTVAVKSAGAMGPGNGAMKGMKGMKH